MHITFCCTDTRPEPWLEGLRTWVLGGEAASWDWLIWVRKKAET